MVLGVMINYVFSYSWIILENYVQVLWLSVFRPKQTENIDSWYPPVAKHVGNSYSWIFAQKNRKRYTGCWAITMICVSRLD